LGKLIDDEKFDHFRVPTLQESLMMTSQNAEPASKFLMYAAAFVFFLAESQAILLVHRGQHPFAFPSFLSSYWLPFVAIIPGLIGFLGIRAIYRISSTELAPATRSTIVKWFSCAVVFSYVLFGYTINTIQVMTARW
jgi:hypothetical protein